MTADEGKRILAALTAVWPNAFGREGIPAVTVRAWLDQLRDIHVEAGQEAVKRLATEDDRFPSYSRFLAVAKDIERRNVARAARERALPPPRYTEEERARGLREARAIKSKLRGGNE